VYDRDTAGGIAVAAVAHAQGGTEMITPEALRDSRLTAKRSKDGDLMATERLKTRLARARDKRVPFYLTQDELLEICRWKLGDQYVRSARLLESSSPKRVRRVTELAFAVKDGDPEFELGARLAILRLLPGVGLGVASAILALCWPKRFGPIDARLWQAVCDEPRDSFDTAEYRRYLSRLRELEDEVRALDGKGRWCVQLVAFYAARSGPGQPV
jgi:uncharacterized membrane protein